MDHYTRSSLNCFAGYSIQRHAEKRQNSAWIQEQLQKSSSKLVLVWQGKTLYNADHQPIFLSPQDLEKLDWTFEESIFLTIEEDCSYFAIQLPSQEDQWEERLAQYGSFFTLRESQPSLGDRDAALIAYAHALTYWNRRGRFCGSCGSVAKSEDSGHKRICQNEACGELNFPRTDPSIIVLVEYDNKCLLGRQATWPENRYSVLAGFVEPGESVENAVHREVMEEAGVSIEEVYYYSSQPWPFPASLMLGYMAKASSPDIHLGDDELEDARWFSREDIRNQVTQGYLGVSSKISIAYRLLEYWFNQGDLGDLAEIIAQAAPKD